MRSAIILSVVLLSIICVVQSKDLIVGTSFNNRLLWQQKAEYNSIPLKKRVKEVFFSDPGQQIIKMFASKHPVKIRGTDIVPLTSEEIRGIIARDLDHTDAEASITAGGVGFSYVNLRLKSERGSGLNYQIELYV